MSHDDAARPARQNGVQSIDRAVAILRCFDARHSSLGISELARMTELSTSTTHRLLGAMTTNGLLRQTADRRYHLGPLLAQLGRNGAMPSSLKEAAVPYMVALRDEVDETVGLHELLPSGDRVVVDQVESRQELRRHYTDIGIPIRLPHGAPGKAILAALPWERQQRILQTPIPAVTERTVTDPATLAAELEQTRARGYAGSDSERTPGIRAVAAPVYDHTGTVIGALGLSVPEVRMGDERADELGRRAAEIAWEVSQALGATRELVTATVARASGPSS